MKFPMMFGINGSVIHPAHVVRETMTAAAVQQNKDMVKQLRYRKKMFATFDKQHLEFFLKTTAQQYGVIL